MSSAEIPDSVPADPSIRTEEWLRSHIPKGLFTLRLRERDGIPFLVLDGGEDLFLPLSRGPQNYLLGAYIAFKLMKNEVRPATEEAAIELEAMDGERVGSALVRNKVYQGVQTFAVDLYDLAGVQVGSFDPGVEPEGTGDEEED
ncbi:MAG TPA: hypothetical protein VGT06_01370 [Candidatus Methylomirabilis sp.]|nr:hypothetical protein [Candidatus Methylomirabilis sp.]